MLFTTLIFIFLLLFLYLVCQRITSVIYRSVFLMTGSSKISIYILTFLILPGTFIHEFSHLVMATLFRVPTGELSILPTQDKPGEIKAGKLMIAHTDPIRHLIIGLAPLISGLTIIYLLGNFFSPYLSFSILNTKYLILYTLIACYFLFALSITMFSSRKDIESLIIVGPIMLILAASFYYMGVKIIIDPGLVEKINRYISSMNYYLFIALIIDYVLLIVFSLIEFLIQKLRGF